MTVKYRIIIVALLLILLLSGCQRSDLSYPLAEDGVMDLSGWDFLRQGSISLDGNWAFYWNDMLSPGDFGSQAPTGYLPVPAYWTRYQGQLPSRGYATYRLVIKTDGVARLYGLRTPELYTEYALWVDGQLLDACGYFADQDATYLHPQTYDYYAEASDIEIVLQVKNDAHVYGGIGQSIRLGTSSGIRKERDFVAAFDIILVSICLFAGLYYLILYLFRKKNAEYIWFFILCVSVALRNLLSNTTLIMQAFPDTPFWLGSRLITLTVPIIAISLLFYTYTLFKEDVPVTAFKVLLSVNFMYAAIILIVPSGVYSYLFKYYLLTVGAACIALGMYVSVRATTRKRKDSVFFLAGIPFIAVGAILDSLNYMQVISIGYVFSAGLFCFIILQVILLAKRYAGAFHQAERLTDNLQISLDKLMNTETAFMGAQMKPHFLYNALTTIAEKCETDAAAAGKLIISLSKYLRQTLDYDNLSGMVPLKKELDLVYAYTSIERARFTNIEVVADIPTPLPSLLLPPLTLQPLVENAIKHGLRKKRTGGRVVVRAEMQEKCMLFTVKDNGIGIPDDVLDKLVTLPNGSASIGLYNIHTRLIRLYGKGLLIKSQNGIGTCVNFEIPF